jgi:hypothetical protein
MVGSPTRRTEPVVASGTEARRAFRRASSRARGRSWVFASPPVTSGASVRPPRSSDRSAPRTGGRAPATLGGRGRTSPCSGRVRTGRPEGGRTTLPTTSDRRQSGHDRWSHVSLRWRPRVWQAAEATMGA